MALDSNSSIGQFLRQERERRGLTVEQVASATKIGIKYLHALEADRYEELPAKPFIRGFVASYARFVGLDAREILTQFGDFIEQKSSERPKRESGHSGYAFERREGDQSRTILTVVMVGFIVVFAAMFIFFKPHHRHKKSSLDKLRSAHQTSVVPVSSPAPSPAVAASHLPVAAPSVAPQATPLAVPFPAATVAAAPSPAPSASPTPAAPDPLNNGSPLKNSEIKQKVVIKAAQSVWVRYRVDQRPEMEFILRAGRILVLRAQEVAILQLSDPNAVSMSYNQGGYRPPLSGNNCLSLKGDATCFFPRDVAQSTSDPFPGKKALSARSVPVPRAVTPAASPTPVTEPTVGF